MKISNLWNDPGFHSIRLLITNLIETIICESLAWMAMAEFVSQWQLQQTPPRLQIWALYLDTITGRKLYRNIYILFVTYFCRKGEFLFTDFIPKKNKPFRTVQLNHCTNKKIHISVKIKTDLLQRNRIVILKTS